MTTTTIGAHVAKDDDAQVIAATAALTWDTETQDDSTFFDGAEPTRITAVSTGWHTFECSLVLATSSAQRRLQLQFAVNGVAVAPGRIDETLTPGPVRLSTTAKLYLTAADYVEVWATLLAGDVTVDNGSALVVTADSLASVNTDLSAVTVSAAVAATGSITCATKANLVDGETFTISDGVNTPTVFEFDVAGDGVTPGNVVVDVSGATTAADVAAIVITAINGVVGTLLVTASAGATGVVTLTADTAGTLANVAVTDTVAHASFVPAGLTGGVDRGAVVSFAAGGASVQTIAITGPTKISTTGLVAGQRRTLLLAADGTTRALNDFPAWIWAGDAEPTQLAANKHARLDLISSTTADAGVFATYFVEA